MTDYRKIWQSINDESASETEKSLIARRIPSTGVFSQFLATDVKKNIRLLYVETGNSIPVAIEKLPVLRGMEIVHTVTSLGDFKNSTFLKFTQSIPQTSGIFESVISDICDSISILSDASKLGDALMRVLGEWRYFFERPQNKILSVPEQKGLMGELIFLEEYLFKKYDFQTSLLSWTGADRTNHDFQIEHIAIEVKTTSAKQHKKFIVSSERQLDKTGLQHLYLVLFSLNLHDNRQAGNLPAQIDKIAHLIQGDSIAAYRFEVMLAKWGYNHSLKKEYNIGFSHAGMQAFEVVKGFPAIVQGTLPSGVGDIKYSVVVSACRPFEINTDILKLL